MKVITYIIKSQLTGRYYCGIASDTFNRLKEHNAGKCRSTKSGIPWEKIYEVAFDTREQAHKLELKIKSYGTKRFLLESGRGPDLTSG